MSSRVFEPDFADEPPPLQRTASAKHGMVATAHDGATQAGIEMLERGGNAFDAAVAAAVALGVCEPQASGIGGQSMVFLYDAQRKQTIALDGSSRAPERATPETIPKDRRKHGYRSVAVPSTPAVMADLLDRYGTLSREEVLAPAIRLAEDGYRVSRLQNRIQRKYLRPLRANTAAPYFLSGGREPYAPGSLHVQEELADTLDGLARRGFEDFYHGHIAKAIVRDMEDHDGLITSRDLDQIPWPIERPPDIGSFGPYRVASFPPPGAGRVLLQILNVLDKTPKRLRDPDTPAGAVYLARTIRQAIQEHHEEPREPARHALTPHRMVMPERAERLARRLRQALPRGETTHLSVMDEAGNAVGITQSIEQFYGSCCVTEGLGFLYNDYIYAFEHEDPRHPYALRPNAVPWSSVAPAILFRHGRPVTIVGSPGTDRIAPVVAQVLLRMQRTGAMDAVEAPRLHATPDDRATLEAPRFRDDVVLALQEDGFDVVERDAYSTYLGCVQLVTRERGTFVGVADPRRDGSAGGPREHGRNGLARRDAGK